MNKNRFAKRAAVIGGLIFLFAAPSLVHGQSDAPPPKQTPQPASPAAEPEKDARAADPYAGMTFTPEQQAKIRLIHKDFKVRREAVIKDDKLSADQKEAMLEGFRRMENAEVFKALTPEQQKKARDAAFARRRAAKAAQERPSQPQ